MTTQHRILQDVFRGLDEGQGEREMGGAEGSKNCWSVIDRGMYARPLAENGKLKKAQSIRAPSK